MRNVEAATLMRIEVPSSNLIRIFLKFGKDLFLFLLFAWLTLFPTMGPLPVKKHFLDITSLS